VFRFQNDTFTEFASATSLLEDIKVVTEDREAILDWCANGLFRLKPGCCEYSAPLKVWCRKNTFHGHG